jgi:hypothetical protein
LLTLARGVLTRAAQDVKIKMHSGVYALVTRSKPSPVNAIMLGAQNGQHVHNAR